MKRTDELFEALRKGDRELVGKLLASDPELADSTNAEGATPALWAVYTGHPDLAELALAGRAPDFFEACALGSSDRVAGLARVDAGLVNGYSRDGFTGLGLAVFFKHKETARMLLEVGAEAGRASRNRMQVAPLHSAVASGNLALVELLLEYGAQPDPVESSGLTPLHSAAAHGSREMVHSLLLAGADPRRTTQSGKTAADLACDHGHTALAEEIAAHAS